MSPLSVSTDGGRKLSYSRPPPRPMNDHVGNAVDHLRLADLVADFFVSRIELGADSRRFHFGIELAGIRLLVPYSALFSETKRTFTWVGASQTGIFPCVMLDENADEIARSSRSITRCIMIGTMLLSALLADILHLKPLTEAGNPAEWYRTARFCRANPRGGNRSSGRKTRRPLR